MGSYRREEAEAVFHFRWEEFNTSQATRRPDSDFGLILLDRVAPEAIGGTAKRYFTDVSYVYELTAPMETVVDMTERERTDQISAPVGRRVRPPPLPACGERCRRTAGTARAFLHYIPIKSEEMADGTIPVAVAARRADSGLGADLRLRRLALISGGGG